MKAYKYSSNLYYIGEQECQLDPIASRRQGHDVWLLPANCTWIEPPENKNGYKVKWMGGEWGYEEIFVEPKPETEPQTIDKIKAVKISELKEVRDTKELEPVQYIDHLYDFDTKSFDRINAAIIALDQTQGTIGWTTADNQVVEVNADALRGVIASAAIRSNALHVIYRELKEAVNAATTVEEVNSISWPPEE